MRLTGKRTVGDPNNDQEEKSRKQKNKKAANQVDRAGLKLVWCRLKLRGAVASRPLVFQMKT